MWKTGRNSQLFKHASTSESTASGIEESRPISDDKMQIMGNEVTAIVLNWNGKYDTLQCLDSLQRQERVTLDVMVVDNGSTDGSVAAVREGFPAVRVLETGANLGYAGGNNVGMKFALSSDSDFVLVLNNDIILDPSCVSNLVAELRSHPETAAAAPKSYYYDKPEVIYFAGGRIDSRANPLHVGGGQRDGPSFASASDSDWLTGCAILFRSSALARIGLFAPEYFLLFEDADWSLRARKRGFTLRFAPTARLWHKVSPGFGGTWSPNYLYYYTRNACLWIERCFPSSHRPYLHYYAVKRAFDLARNASKYDAISGISAYRPVWTIGVADLVRTHILSKNHRLPGAPKDVKARCRAFVARGGTSET
jgi:GT2 family glycosyltransferase